MDTDSDGEMRRGWLFERRGDDEGFAGGGGAGDDAVAVTDAAFAAERGADFGAFESAVAPREVDDLEAAAGAQAANGAGGPGGGKRGKELDFAAVRLEEHFGDA